MLGIGKGIDMKEIPENRIPVDGYKEIKPESDITLSEALDYLNHLFEPENLDKTDYSMENTEKKQDLTYEEKVKKQDKEISDVENGKKDFDRSNTHETGNYGEMKTDQDLSLIHI